MGLGKTPEGAAVMRQRAKAAAAAATRRAAADDAAKAKHATIMAGKCAIARAAAFATRGLPKRPSVDTPAPAPTNRKRNSDCLQDDNNAAAHRAKYNAMSKLPIAGNLADLIRLRDATYHDADLYADFDAAKDVRVLAFTFDAYTRNNAELCTHQARRTWIDRFVHLAPLTPSGALPLFESAASFILSLTLTK